MKRIFKVLSLIVSGLFLSSVVLAGSGTTYTEQQVLNGAYDETNARLRVSFGGAVSGDLEMGDTPYSIDGGTNGLVFDVDNAGTNNITMSALGLLTCPDLLVTGSATINVNQTVLSNITMGSATANAGVFSMIQGAVASDPTFSITQATNDVTLAQTIGDITLSAGDDIFITPTGSSVTINPTASTSGVATGLTYTDPACTGITAATERNAININTSSTKTWAAGAGPLADQREVYIKAPTYAGTAGTPLTITRATTLYVEAAPVQGSNMTLSSNYALWVDDGMSRLDGTVFCGSYIDIGSYNRIFASTDVGSSNRNLRIGVDSTNNTLILTRKTGVEKNFDHGDQTHPTLYIQSNTDPDTANTEWGSLSYIGTGAGAGYFNIANGVGSIVLAPVTSVGIGTADFDGTPAAGRLIIKGTTNDGTTNALVLRDSDEANILQIDTDGKISTVGQGKIYTSATDAAGQIGLVINNTNAITAATGAKLFELQENTSPILSVLKQSVAGQNTIKYELSGGGTGTGWSRFVADGRLDIVANGASGSVGDEYIVLESAKGIYFSGDSNHARTGDASSTATQKGSYALGMQNSLWNGATTVTRYFSLKDIVSTTVNLDHRAAFILDGTLMDGTGGTEVFSLNKSGASFYAQSFYPLWLPAGSVSIPALTFPLDSNSGLYYISDGVHGYSINETNVFSITATGLGVGTTTPEGWFSVSGNYTTSGRIGLSLVNTNTTATNASMAIKFAAGTASGFLTAYNSTYTASDGFADSIALTTNSAISTTASIIIGNLTTSGLIKFYTGGANERMTITSDGYVGIGTTDFDGTPAIGRLIVKGTTNDGTTNIFVGRDSDEANVSYLDTNGNFYTIGRKLGFQGVDVASANDITLGNGNYFDITGTTEVQRILGTGWTAGSIITLQFDASVNIKHGTAAGSDYYGLQLAEGADFAATAGDTLMLVFDGAWWREISRTAI